MRCGQCDKTTGVIFNSLPAKVKCSIDNQLHEMSEQCKIEFVPLIHGHWEIVRTDSHTTCRCSACHTEYYYYNKGQYQIDTSEHCPHCGALMDEVPKIYNDYSTTLEPGDTYTASEGEKR